MYCELGLGRLSFAFRSWRMLRHWWSTPKRVGVCVRCFEACVGDIGFARQSCQPVKYVEALLTSSLLPSIACLHFAKLSSIFPKRVCGSQHFDRGAATVAAMDAASSAHLPTLQLVGRCRRARCKSSGAVGHEVQSIGDLQKQLKGFQLGQC